MWNIRLLLIVFLLIFAFGNPEMIKKAYAKECFIKKEEKHIDTIRNELFMLYTRVIKNEFIDEVKRYKNVKTDQFFSIGASFSPLAKSITVNLDMQPKYKWYYIGDRHFFLSNQELKGMLLKVVEEIRIDYSIYYSRRNFLEARAKDLNIKNEIAKDIIDSYIPSFSNLYLFIFIRGSPIATYKDKNLRLNWEK
ncbi:MAG: hypothetical protein J7J73_01660 [Deltaproteobacteria bacterium]|nr:hypothetical protein [Deltaproteobacteria bacterium]